MFTDRKSPEMNAERKQWASPQLRVLGDVKSLTMGAGPGMADMGMGNFGRGPDRETTKLLGS